MIDKKERNRAYQAKWYLANKKVHQARALEQKLKSRDYIRSVKEAGKCKLCPQDHPRALDFHHREGEEKLLTYLVAGNTQVLTNLS